uniref:Si:ch211-153b23.5 n=1 Tax=Dicentrarchus labrax TaxID=13489 RepID=A0A8C4EHH5_DICLA
MVKRVAVILSGCGVYDGTEIHEASAVLVHLSRAEAKVQMFAPDADQMHVVNHCEGKPTEEKRNILQESARIARGNVTDLAKLDVSAFDAAIIPGGFGVAKNLSDWAVNNKDCAIQPDLEKLIKAFHKAGKPLGMCCISPILAAKIMPGCELTVGQDKECEKWPYAQTAEFIFYINVYFVHIRVDMFAAHLLHSSRLQNHWSPHCQPLRPQQYSHYTQSIQYSTRHPSHPLHSSFVLLPSRRRYRTLACNLLAMAGVVFFFLGGVNVLNVLH